MFCNVWNVNRILDCVSNQGSRLIDIYILKWHSFFSPLFCNSGDDRKQSLFQYYHSVCCIFYIPFVVFLFTIEIEEHGKWNRWTASNATAFPPVWKYLSQSERTRHDKPLELFWIFFCFTNKNNWGDKNHLNVCIG